MNSASSSSNNSFIKKFYSDIMPIVYGIGAAVVIIGAMFKLLNLSGASVMLAAGLSTEAILFILGAFEPKHKEFDWYKVYPQFKEDSKAANNHHIISEIVPSKPNLSKKTEASEASSVSSKLDEIFAKAKIDSDLVDRLGKGMGKIAEYADSMASFATVPAISEKYCNSLSNASGMLDQMLLSHEKISSALSTLSNIADGGKGYTSKMNDIMSSLEEIGIAYKKELTSVDQRLNYMNSIFNDFKSSTSQLDSVEVEASTFKEELKSLNSKFQSLNNVYGNMLSALKKD